MQLVEGLDLRFGEQVIIRLSNLKFSTVFRSDFIGLEGALALFTLPTSFARHPGDPKSRFRRPAPPLKLLIGKDWVPVQSVDISYGGLSILTPQHFNVGTLLALEADFGDVQTRFQLRVHYSVNDKEEQGSARVGGEILSFPRVDLHRWRIWIESQSGATSQYSQRAA